MAALGPAIRAASAEMSPDKRQLQAGHLRERGDFTTRCILLQHFLTTSGGLRMAAIGV